MEFEIDVKRKIELHGGSIKREIMFSNLRFLLVIVIVAVLLRGSLNPMVIMLIFIYGAFILTTSLRKLERYKVYYTFMPGNPTYDMISQYGEPEAVLNEINEQARSGKIIYNTLAAPDKAVPETLITEGWFVHFNKRATIIPMDKIVCAYIYDGQSKETPDDRQTPSRFKPLYFVITYGEGKEAVFIYSSLDYKAVLGILDEKLGCKVKYTREMGMLYKTDYDTFLQEVAKAKTENAEAV